MSMACRKRWCQRSAPPARATLNQVEQRRMKERAKPEKRLAGVEAQLHRLGWRHRRQYTELIAEVALRRAALRIAEWGLRALRHSSAPEIAPQREPSSRLTSAPAQARSVRTREAPELGLDIRARRTLHRSREHPGSRRLEVDEPAVSDARDATSRRTDDFRPGHPERSCDSCWHRTPSSALAPIYPLSSPHLDGRREPPPSGRRLVSRRH